MIEELSDGVIRLRPFREEDIDLVYNAVRESIAELAAWMAWCSEGYSRADAATHVRSRTDAWKNDSEYSFAVFDVATNEFLGSLGLNYMRREYQMVNLGYWIRTSHTKRGTATRATRLGARFALENLGLRRVEIIAAVGNLPSQRVAEKAGAQREGVLRKRLIVNGVQTDAVMYSLVAEDFENL
jgi:RimJ/RimL family protein N-acetyltransferase